MKIVATSDLHGYFPTIEPCDLLLIAGDVCPIHSKDYDLRAHEKPAQKRWMRKEFMEWCSEQPAEDIVWIAGNHDFGAETPGFSRAMATAFPSNCHYLYQESIEIQGKTIFGMPFTPNLANWAFYASDMAWEWLGDDIPTDTDILLMHSPPAGVMLDGGHPGWAAPYILENTIINRVNPELCVFGHIHEGYGEITIRGTTFTNVAFCDEDYNPTQPPKEYTL